MRAPLAALLLPPLLAAALPAIREARAQSPPPVRGMVELAAAVESAPFARIESDALVVPVFEDEELPAALPQPLDEGLAAAIRSAAGQKAASGELFTSASFFNPAGLATRRLILLGAGKKGDLDAERLRRLAGAAARQLRTQKIASLVFHVRGGVEPAAAASALTEGAILGLYDPGFHKSEPKPVTLKTFRVAGLEGEPGALAAAVERGSLFAQATNFARSITMEPTNYKSPEILAAHAREVAREAGVEIEVFDEKRMAKMGMGGVLAVGKGSANPARFIVLRYRPAHPTSVTLALAGKGVCFDSGGISIKPAEEMHRMKGDMAGGAAVLAAMKIIGRLKPRVGVLGVIPAVENIPGPAAQRPGDVYTGYSGKKVEVLNTDAEGRLILSDAVSYALKEGATHVVDVATLTGAVRVALGDRRVGTYASDDALYEDLLAASRRTGESFWRLPLDEEYAKKIKESAVADLTETGGDAGSVVGAKFIQQFTQGKPWIHLDIAGASWPKDPPAWLATGPTGVAARTLAELAVILGEKQGS
jgi:leucyl aminopeptidase